MTTLYQINKELEDLLMEGQEFDESTSSDITDNWLARFTELQGEQKDKLEGVMAVRQQAIYNAQMYKSEIDRLAEKAKAEQRTAERMEQMLDMYMQNEGKTEITTDRFSAKYRKNPPSMVLDPKFEIAKMTELGMPAIEAQLLEKKSIFSEWKKTLKAHAIELFKSGETLEGVTIKQGQRLEIK